MRRFLTLFCLFVFLLPCAAERRVSGFVKDAQSREVLIGANVWCVSGRTGVATDNRGYFQLQSGPDTLVVSYVGYATRKFPLPAGRDTLLQVLLSPSMELQELEVTASRPPRADVVRLTADQMAFLPALGGKPDVVKALQLMAGIQGATEGSSLMMVRGGDPGQNQYLLDNVPLVYVNHLGGFMSVFNPEIINSIDVYKGNFPARFGGKLAGIVDLTQREGDVSGHKGSFSIGLTDASLTFEGPLSENRKWSYLVTARKTFTEALMAAASGLLMAENNSVMAYGFHDVNAKITYRPDERNSLSLNLYQGDDYLGTWLKKMEQQPDVSGNTGSVWGNFMVSGRWNHVISSKLFAENILSYTRYRFRESERYSDGAGGAQSDSENIWRSSVQDLSWRSAWKFSAARWWRMEVGSQLSWLSYEPNYVYASLAPSQQARQIYRSAEMAVYWENRIELGRHFLLQPSVRLSGYATEDAFFWQPEPRLSLQYSPWNGHTFTLAAMTVSQNAHLLFADGFILKNEVWFPALKNVPPQRSGQLSGGWTGYFHDRMFSVQLEGYYKKMENLVALKDGYHELADLADMEQKLETGGVGEAYGVELTLKKEKGVWTGFLTYAWSESWRMFQNINGGKPYDFEYNRPHSFAVSVNRKLGEHWNLNVLWVCASGLPYTPAAGRVLVPSGTFDANGLPVMEEQLVYGDKYSARLPLYHRLDVGAVYDYRTRRGNRAQWSFSVYNLYNRMNAYDCAYLSRNPGKDDFPQEDTTLKLYQISYFPIIPTFSWKMYFDYSAARQKHEPKRRQPSEKPARKHGWLYLE